MKNGYQIFGLVACVAAVAAGAWWWYSNANQGAGDGSADGDASSGAGDSSAQAADNAATEVLNTVQGWATNIGVSLGIVTPKGIRNNNPGNLRYVATIQWLGQTGDDGSGYAVFDTAEHGVRALGHQLNAYFNRGINTVSAIINTWAPTVENDTGSYVSDVAGRLGVDPSQLLTADAIPALSQAIIIHENGTDPYGFDAISQWSTEA